MNNRTELKIGTLVRSRCGRDRKRVFVVVGIDENDPVSPVFVADGKLRKSDSPKKKNPIHLLPFGEITDVEKNALKNGVSNEEIAQIVEKYDISCKE